MMSLTFWQAAFVQGCISCAGAAVIIANSLVARGEARWPSALAWSIAWSACVLLAGTVFVAGLRCLAHGVIP